MEIKKIISATKSNLYPRRVGCGTGVANTTELSDFVRKNHSDAHTVMFKGFQAAQNKADLYKSGFKVAVNGELQDATIVKMPSLGAGRNSKEISHLNLSDGESLGALVTQKVSANDDFDRLHISLPKARENAFCSYVSEKTTTGTEKAKGFTYIESLTSNSDAKGIDAAFIKHAVQKSMNEGDEGRVMLRAINSTDLKNSPVPFYKEFGFEFVDPQKNEAYKQWQGTDTPLPYNLLSGIMYLPKQNVQKALNCSTV